MENLLPGSKDWLRNSGPYFQDPQVLNNQAEPRGLRPHLVDHVFTRDGNIVGRSTLLDLGIHGFVGVKGLVLDLDSCFFCKLSQEFRIDIVSPVVDNQFLTISAIDLLSR